MSKAEKYRLLVDQAMSVAGKGDWWWNERFRSALRVRGLVLGPLPPSEGLSNLADYGALPLLAPACYAQSDPAQGWPEDTCILWAPSARVTVLRDTNLLDVVPTLRSALEGLEAGEFGEPKAAVLVVDADGLEVFYCGTGEAGPNAHLLLQTGAAKMMQAVLRGKD